MPQIDEGILEAALAGLEAQKEIVETLVAELKAVLGRRAPIYSSRWNLGSKAPIAVRKKRIISAAARKSISAAQKKRWANFRKSQKG